MHQPVLEETIYLYVITYDSNSVPVDADELPTCEVLKDASETAILSPTVAKRTGKTGQYRIPIACTAANSFESNKSYNILLSATIGGVDYVAVAATFQVRGASVVISSSSEGSPISVNVESMDDNVISAGAVAAAAVTKIQSGLSTYAGGDTSGTTTLLSRITGNITPQTGDAYARIGANGAGLTALGDTRIANLDAAISTRSTYAGADTSGTTTLLTRLTNTRAGLLDNMDAAVSTRMATFSYTTPPTAAAIATAILTTTDSSNFAVDGSPGKVLATQLGGAFTTQSSSVLKDTSLANVPSGSGVTLEELQTELTTRYVTTANMRAIAAVSFGDWSENSDHTATTFKDVNNSATTVITSVNTATSRTVTLED